MNLIGLHGFLGTSKDFEGLTSLRKFDHIWTPNLFLEDQRLLQKGFNDFCDQALSELQKQGFVKNNVLVGYSLGGRLALHLALKAPELFERVILISTHPGIFCEEEILQRRMWEGLWCKKMSRESFEQWTSEWLSQPLFQGDSPRDLKEPDFDLQTLICGMTLFSNPRHEFDWESMIKFPSGLTWVHGELDLKFGKIHQKIKSERPQDQLISIPDRGHRLLGPQSQTWLSQIF